MEVGVVRVAEDKDYSNLKSLIDNHSGWKLDYNKSSIKVWTKNLPDSSFKMVKVIAVFPEIPGEVIYDVLHDPEYRRLWDQHMIESKDIGFLNPNNDVGYYSMSCPSPLANRDFVLQRSWLDLGEEKYILNHSVFHKDYPPRKGFIRATSHLTGFLIKANSVAGCTLGYISQTDPQGTLPPWLVNKVTQIFGPKMVKNLQKATLGYEDWKNSNNPYFKPWVYPEQIRSPRLNISDFDVSIEQHTEVTAVDAIKISGNMTSSLSPLSPRKVSVLSIQTSNLSLAKSDSALHVSGSNKSPMTKTTLRSDTSDALSLKVSSDESTDKILLQTSETDLTNHKNLKPDKNDSGLKRKISDKDKKEWRKSSDKIDPINSKMNSAAPNAPKEKKKISPYTKLKNSIRKKTGLSPKGEKKN